jgi:hypothetical protein
LPIAGALEVMTSGGIARTRTTTRQDAANTQTINS